MLTPSLYEGSHAVSLYVISEYSSYIRLKVTYLSFFVQSNVCMIELEVFWIAKPAISLVEIYPAQ